MPPTLCSETGMFEVFAKERKRNADERSEAYLVGRRDKKLVKEDRRMVAPLLLYRTSSTTIVQKAKNAKGQELMGTEEEERVWRDTDSEFRKV